MDERTLKCKFAELKVHLAATAKGIVVSEPTTPTRYDLILDDHGKLSRVQVKYADADSSHSEGSVLLNFFNDEVGDKCYTCDEIDLILVYVPKIDAVVEVKPEIFTKQKSLHIRFADPKNGQKKGIFLAKDNLWVSNAALVQW